MFFCFFFSEQHAYCHHVFNDDQCIYYWLSGSEDIPNFRSSLHSGWMDCLVFCSQICNLDFGKVFDGIRSWNYISCHYIVFEWNFFDMFFAVYLKKIALCCLFLPLPSFCIFKIWGGQEGTFLISRGFLSRQYGLSIIMSNVCQKIVSSQ